MFRFVLATLCLAQLTMAIFLKVDDPSPNRWYDLESFGVGGVVELHADLGQSPVVEMKLGSSNSDNLFNLVSNEESTRITTPLSAENVDGSGISLAGLNKIKIVVQLQGEGVFVDFVGVGSVVLRYPEEGWSGNTNAIWDTVNGINRVYVGGQNVSFTKLRGHVLVY